LNNLDLNN